MQPPQKILVVDDHTDLLDNLALTLESAGFDAVTAQDGVEALKRLHSHNVDLIIADIAMPRMNGYQLFEQVRANPEWVAIPFLFLSARALDSDIRYGKELGADDYLAKPIQPEDLLAAVRGKLLRANQLAQAWVQSDHTSPMASGALVVGRLQINPDSHQVEYKGETVRLSAREFTLLENLARQPGKVISAEALIKITHGYETDHVEAGALLRPLIRSLRRKLGFAVGEMGCIENIRGIGYRLVET